jgi:hypothetical protein
MIKNTEDANKYYQLVNQYIDEYVDKWKIKPTNLKNYLLGNKSRLVNFLERKGLKDISNINRVVLDVVEDRVAMHTDGVMTFENFKFFESDEFKILDIKQCLYKGIDKATVEHEKILADYWDASLSQIDIISAEKHIFKFNDLEVVIYNKSEIDTIKENIKDYVLNQTFNKTVKLDLGKSDLDLNVNIKDFMDEDKFKNKIDEILTTENVKNIISSILDGKKRDNNTDEGDNFISVLQ